MFVLVGLAGIKSSLWSSALSLCRFLCLPFFPHSLFTNPPPPSFFLILISFRFSVFIHYPEFPSLFLFSRKILAPLFHSSSPDFSILVSLSSPKMDLLQNPSKAARILFMSMGFISTLVLFKVAIIPCVYHFVLFTFPRLLVSARTSLSPVFVYIIVNFIIITIAASSYFHHKTAPFSDPKHTPTVSAADDFITEDYSVPDLASVHRSEHGNQSNEPEEEEKSILEDSALSSCDKSGADPPPPEKCANDYVSPDADDTLDATWRAIMEGQGMTMKPKLKKSDTCGARIEKAGPFRDNEGGGEEDDNDPVAWARKELKKSETFNDTTSLQRDKSMTPEELNLRAEAFIQNFINQMRLQRLESDQRFMEMVNRRS